MPNKLSIEEFIQRSNHIHHNRYDYSEVVYHNTTTKISIYCNEHGLYFMQSPKNHLLGKTGCQKCSLNKFKQTNLERHGVMNPAQSLIIQEKMKQTNLKHHGVENVFQSLIIQKKIKATMIEKYGVEHPLQSPIIREKMKQTNIKIHGVEHALQSPIFMADKNQTMLSCHGVVHALHSPMIQEKMKQTNIERHGVENVFQSPIIQEKMKQSNLERHGVEHHTQLHIPPQSLALLDDTQWLIEQHHEKEQTLFKIAEELSVDPTTVANYFRKHDLEIKYFAFSMGEKEILEYVKTIVPTKITVQSNVRTVIPPYELDIYIPEYTLAIEYNGEYWHRNSHEKDQLKQTMCEEQGITLVTVWENQWLNNPEMIKNVILNSFRKNYCIVHK